MKKVFQKELYSTAHDWLRLCGNKISASYCRNELTSHPEYPALTSLVDLLDSGNMKYQAVSADETYLEDFNYPLLAHVKEPGNEYFRIVKGLGEWEQASLRDNWSGVVVFPEISTRWNNEENEAARRKLAKQNIIFSLWIILGIILWAWTSYFIKDFAVAMFGLLSLIGITFSIAASAVELGIQSSAVKRVCGTVSNGGCEKVLQSRFAKGILGITPSDASILYFVAQFAVFLTFASTGALGLLKYLGFVGILVAGLSLYSQGKVIKQWCAICLGIVGVLAAQAFLSFIIIEHSTINSSLTFLVSVILGAMILFPLKWVFQRLNFAVPKVNELNKWKSDIDLFKSQLSRQQNCDNSVWPGDVILGNPSASIKITVACNPYCDPCKNAHIKLDKMLLLYGDRISVQVRLLCDYQKPENEKTVAVLAIMQEVESASSSKEVEEMLTDWFEWMDLEKWREKWNKGIQNEVSSVVRKHSEWMKANSIRYTPTIFVNGNMLPTRYELEQFQKLIPELPERVEEFDEVGVVV